MEGEKERNSSIELLRIVMMIVIIAHHYVVHSGVEELFDYGNPNSKMIFLKCFGLFGKMAINCFVLITGFFMCQKKLKIKKVLQLYLEVKFYQIIMYIIMVAAGFTNFNVKGLLITVVSVLRSGNEGFVSAFLALYILIPFINILINNIKEKDHLFIIVFFIILYTVPRSFLHGGTYSYMGWYFNVYLIGAYIKKYPKEWMKKTWLNAVVSLISWGSIVLITALSIKKGSTLFYWLICESCDLFSIVIGLFIFLLFNNLKIPHSRVINVLAKTTFGILLIHIANDGIRDLLWNKIFAVSYSYQVLSLYSLVLHSILSVIIVFIVCAIIDMLRIYLIEKPLFRLINRHYSVKHVAN